MSSRARGRSPARRGTTPAIMKSATTPKRNVAAEKPRRSNTGASAETLDGKTMDRSEMSGLADTEARFTRKLKNTPEHLYGKNHGTVTMNLDTGVAPGIFLSLPPSTTSV